MEKKFKKTIAHSFSSFAEIGKTRAQCLTQPWSQEKYVQQSRLTPPR